MLSHFEKFFPASWKKKKQFREFHFLTISVRDVNLLRLSYWLSTFYHWLGNMNGETE